MGTEYLPGASWEVTAVRERYQKLQATTTLVFDS